MAVVGLICGRGQARHCHQSIFNTVDLASVRTLDRPPFVPIVELLIDSELLICNLFTKKVHVIFN